MKKRGTNHAASVRARLLNRFQQTGGTFDFLLRRYAGERFLYRLGESAHREELVLKGAALFAIWGRALYRPTRDLDFAGYGPSDTAAVLARIRRICEVSLPEDGLRFDLDDLSAAPIRVEGEYEGLRIEWQATLERARIPMRIDIGFGNRIEPGPREVEYPPLLADLPAPRIRAYPREAVVAEKLHAMATHGEQNTRLKDFYDLHAMARHFAFESDRLMRAIAATFHQRGTPIGDTPACFTPRFYAEPTRAEAWRTYLTRNDLPAAPADFSAVGEVVEALLGPIWNALVRDEVLDETWPPAGPWPHRKQEGESS